MQDFKVRRAWFATWSMDTFALLLQSDTGLGLLPLQLLLLIPIFYFLVILPAQRQKKAQQKMLQELAPGNVVVTTGGLVGTILAVNPDETLVLRVRPDNIKLQVTRQSVTGIVSRE